MATLNLRIKQLRNERDITLDELAKILGTTKATLSRYENNLRTPNAEFIEQLASFFDVSTDYLLGKSDIKNPEKFYKNITIINQNNLIKIPILGVIKAGEPIFAEQNIIGYEYVDKKDISDGDYFYLIVKGDSMNKSRIEDGDMVLVRSQNDVNDGDIAIVLINGCEATLKRVYKTKDALILQPDSTNPKHKPIILNSANSLPSDVKILGKVIHAKIKF